MTLAECIRKGAAQRPQAFTVMFTPVDEDNRDMIRSCVLGAAYEGLIGSLDSDRPVLPVLQAAFPWTMTDRMRVCPACAACPHRRVLSMAAHLNDEHHWPREQTAAWIEEIAP